MQVPTHALAGWLIAEAGGLRERRDRRLVLAAGLVMDLDAGSALFGHEAYVEWHRTLLHNVVFAAVVTAACAVFGRQKLRCALLGAISFHAHLLGDLVGSAGPDGSIWAVPYFQPFSAHEVMVRWQWGLASWQNGVLTAALLVLQLLVARRVGRTITEAFSPRADRAVMEVIHRRFPVR